MKKALSVIHPWLFAAFPVAFLFAQNLNELRLVELVVPLLLVIASAGALFAVSNIFLKDLRRAGLVTSITFFLFFSYGHVWSRFGGQQVGSVYIDKDLYLLVPWLPLSAAVILLATRVRRNLKEVTVILNAIALVLVAGPAYSIATRGTDADAAGSDCPPALTSRTASLTANGRTAPDIYYINLDRYGPQPTLTRRFGFDNSAFLSYLKSKGFYIPEHARANYPRTGHSNAASLNANFLDCLAEDVGTSHQTLLPINSAIKNHAVGRFLKGVGYRYYHIGSWVDVTAKNPQADRNLHYEASRGFASLVYETSMARPFGEVLGLSDNWRVSFAKLARYQFKALIATRKMPGPRFVFGHVLLPHDPYLFDKNGKFLTSEDEYTRSLTVNYTEQLKFTNDQISKVIDALTAGPIETHPIIILQSDEGPHPLRFDEEGPDWVWETASPDELADTLNIFNAIYLPGKGDGGIPSTTTPVNTFRRIFNLYLNANLPLLPEKTFIFRDERHPYLFVDVTDRVRGRSPTP